MTITLYGDSRYEVISSQGRTEAFQDIRHHGTSGRLEPTTVFLQQAANVAPVKLPKYGSARIVVLK